MYACFKHLGISYADLNKMPTYERRFYLNMYIDEMNDRREAQDAQVNNSKGKKSISGESLKNNLRNNTIPNQ